MGYGTPATVGANLPYCYDASGHYRADSVGAVHIAKREAEADAEAEADPYYGHGYSGLGYSGLRSYGGYRGYGGYSRGYSSIGLGYSRGCLGGRGYGYGHGYGYYG